MDTFVIARLDIPGNYVRVLWTPLFPPSAAMKKIQPFYAAIVSFGRSQLIEWPIYM